MIEQRVRTSESKQASIVWGDYLNKYQKYYRCKNCGGLVYETVLETIRNKSDLNQNVTYSTHPAINENIPNKEKHKPKFGYWKWNEGNYQRETGEIKKEKPVDISGKPPTKTNFWKVYGIILGVIVIVVTILIILAGHS